MEKLSSSDKAFLKGYANALQDIMYALTGGNTNGKSYDPIDFDDKFIHSYAFDLKDGGRHHPLKDYKDIGEICSLMLKEATEYCSPKGIEPQNICYKSNEPCKFNCSSLCQESC